MSASFRPTDVKVGHVLQVIGVMGEDLHGDVTFWGEHGFTKNAAVTVREILPPDPETGRDYWGFVCEGRCDWGDDTQTVSEHEVVPYVIPTTPDEIEAFLNDR
jgi:hypothetical protein